MVEFDNKVPIYIQIMNFIKKDIVSGTIKEGEKLPSVREMAESLKVNPNTIQRVYQELERESVTFTQRGMGTFITEDKDKILDLKKEMAKDIITTFIVGMRNLGFKKNEIIEVVNEKVNEEET